MKLNVEATLALIADLYDQLGAAVERYEVAERALAQRDQDEPRQ